MGMDILAIIIWLVSAAVSFFILYWVIRLAVLHALREHTISSTAAVSVVSAVPLTIATPAG
jgi:hypothetical protein